MKENTAAVHVQVPVEVTSFLLNEKRTEITKIELKQRITVLLVPNKNLDTPNYRLERLRHDDPRLENLQASYTMIDEVEEEVGITRREKAKPKQEPVIKGILPETPAPVAPVREQPAAAATPEPIVMAAPVEPAAPAGGGFFGWVKRIFGSDEAAVPAPAAVAPAAPPAAPASAEREARPERGGRGGRGGRDGRDSRRGEGRGGEGRSSEPRGERSERAPRAEGGDGRSSERSERAPRPEGGERPEPREGRDGRGRRGERRDEPGAGEGGDAVRDGQPARTQGESQPQMARNEVREDRGPRPPRGERDSRRGPPPSEGAESVETARLPTSDVAADDGAINGTDAAVGEVRDPARKRRRGGRGGRDRGEAAAGAAGNLDAAPVDGSDAVAVGDGEAAGGLGTAADFPPPLPENGADEGSTAAAGDEPLAREPGDRGPRGEGRRRGGRGRNRRDEVVAPIDGAIEQPESEPPAGGYRETLAAAPIGSAPSWASDAGQPAAAAPVTTAFSEASNEQATAPAMAAEPVAADFIEPTPRTAVAQPDAVSTADLEPLASPAIAAEPAQAREPEQDLAADYVLPAEDLQAIAASAGLEWVGSDAEKIRQVQESLANEPQPVRVPREPKPAIRADDGPLVLVETRKDLSAIKLPFEA